MILMNGSNVMLLNQHIQQYMKLQKNWLILLGASLNLFNTIFQTTAMLHLLQPKRNLPNLENKILLN